MRAINLLGAGKENDPPKMMQLFFIYVLLNLTRSECFRNKENFVSHTQKRAIQMSRLFSPLSLIRNYLKLHNRMVYVHLESICVHADAALSLKEMFDARSTFYALSVAWDFGDEMPIVYGNLPLQLSYNDTRRYEGNLPIFQGHHICGELNLTVFAYQFKGKKQQHKKFLRKLEKRIQAIFAKKNSQGIIISESNVNTWHKNMIKQLNICINNYLKQQDMDTINIFEGLIDIDNAFPAKQKSTINHYHTMGAVELSVKV